MRYAGTTGRSFVAAVVLLLATGSAAVAAQHVDDALPARTQRTVTPALVEASECWDAEGSTPTTFAGTNVQTISLTIEATALLAVDEHGKVTAAETNTGCAPQAGDHVYLVHADGSITDAPGFDVSPMHFTGDFTQFGYHPVVG